MNRHRVAFPLGVTQKTTPPPQFHSQVTTARLPAPQPLDVGFPENHRYTNQMLLHRIRNTLPHQVAILPGGQTQPAPSQRHHLTTITPPTPRDFVVTVDCVDVLAVFCQQLHECGVISLQPLTPRRGRTTHSRARRNIHHIPLTRHNSSTHNTFTNKPH